jgi:hypothetical protein
MGVDEGLKNVKLLKNHKLKKEKRRIKSQYYATEEYSNEKQSPAK